MLIILLVLIVQFGPETAGQDVLILSNMQELIRQAHEVGDIASKGLSSEIEDPVKGKLDELSKRIKELSSSLEPISETALWQIVAIVPRETDLRARMNQLGNYISRVAFHFKVYERISKPNSTFKYNVNQFIETATSMGEDDIIQMLNEMRKLFTGTQESLLSVASSIFAASPITVFLFAEQISPTVIMLSEYGSVNFVRKYHVPPAKSLRFSSNSCHC